MSMELIAIIGVGVTLAGLILNGQRYQREEIKTLREETQAGFKALREEMNQFAGTGGTPGRIARGPARSDHRPTRG